jgi:hypothetical protein
MMRSSRVAILAVLLALLTSTLRAGETVSHKQLGLRLTVPDGFVQTPDHVQGKVIYAFQRPPKEGREVGTLILVSRLGGVLDRKKPDPQQIAAENPQVTFTTEKWKSFDVDVSRVPEQIGEVQTVTFNVLVPLMPEAIQIAVVDEARDEEELRGILRELLANLEGNSNWLTEEERSERLGRGIGKLTCCCFVVVGFFVIVGGSVWRLVQKPKRKPKKSKRDWD